MHTIIDLVAHLIPKDLNPTIAKEANTEEINEYNRMREYLLKDSAKALFDLTIRPILKQYLTMEGASSSPFNAKWVLSKETLEKYLSVLETDDELLKLKKESDGDYLRTSSEYGLF
jgi:hypothetical protein